MRRSRLILTAVAVVTASLLAAGCGGGSDAAAPAPVSSETSVAAVGAVPFDRAFIDAMVPHHEEAITMARAALDEGLASPDLVAIANAVIETQQAEIDQMLEWRMEWFGSTDLAPDPGAVLGLSEAQMGMQHDASMMMGVDDVDAAFAEAMLDHHNGAIVMAQMALERAQHPEMRTLAQRIIEAQQAEMETMLMHTSPDGMSGMDHG